MHVFSFFSPNRNQVKVDTKILDDKIDMHLLVEFICSVSYARYFLEAIILWEPDRDDKVARKYIFKYYSYKDEHLNYCCTCMFALWLLGQFVRFIAFAISNSNEFNSVYDIPMMIFFIFNVLILYCIAFVLMVIIQESYIVLFKDNDKIIKNKIKEDTTTTTTNSIIKKNE